jgi:surfactin synthase thioesterase subunit
LPPAEKECDSAVGDRRERELSGVEKVTEDNRWIRRFHPSPGAAARLICLPHAGGSSSYYFPVSRSLAPVIDVLAVQYPGRQERRLEPPAEDLLGLADSIFDAVRSWCDRPVALFGHSMGATLAFEIATRLTASGVAPLCLFVSGRRAPSRYRESAVHRYDDARLVAEMKKLSGTETRVFESAELLELVLPAIRSDYKAIETYRCRETSRLECPIFAFAGDEDEENSLEEVQTWGEHTAAHFDMDVFPGGHFFLNTHAPKVIDRIRQHMTTLLTAERN